MVLTAEQNLLISTIYDKAAADPMTPSPQRAAFARKSEWFRLRTRVAEINEARVTSKMEGPKTPADARPFVEIAKRAGR